MTFGQAGLSWLMFTVYILRDSAGRLYKGMTNNLERRLREHRSGHTKTTKRMKDLEIVYTELYDTQVEARQRELYLKSSAGRRFLKTKLAEVAQLVRAFA